MDKEKLNSVVDYFKQEDIELPIAVLNSITDVFEENDDIDNVEVYYKNDIEELLKVLHLKKNVFVYIKDTLSKGITSDTFTYYGDVECAYDELTQLLDKDENGEDIVLTEITNIESGEAFVYKEDWAVILIETIKWENGVIDKKDNFIIYAPVIVDEKENLEDDSIYGRL